MTTTDPKKLKILIIDSSSGVRNTVDMVLRRKYEVIGSGDLRESLGLVVRERTELVILGIEYPLSDYLPFLQSLRKGSLRLPVLFLINDKRDRGIEIPLSDWLEKPFYPEELEAKVEALLVRGKGLGREISLSVPDPIEEKVRGWIYSSRISVAEREQILQVCSLPLPVLIEGEEGTGKGWVSRGIHYLGSWRERAYLRISCRGLDKDLFLKKLGDCIRGGEGVRGIDLYLEDLDLLSWEMQGYLSEQMEEGWSDCFWGFGADFGVRVIGSTRGPLMTMVQRGEFRRDLGERLLGLRIYLKPLRERVDEIGCIVEGVLREKGIRKRISEEGMEELRGYGWPGNVAELEGLVERTGMLVTGEEVLKEDWVWRFRRGGFERGKIREEEASSRKGEEKEGREIRSGEGIEALLSTLVHEVKNPLVAISTYAHLLPDRYEDEEFREDFSRLMGMEVKRLNGVLDKLIDYEQTGAPNRKNLDLKKRVGALLGEMRGDIESKRIRIDVSGLEDLPPIQFDEEQLKFVLRSVLESISGREVEKREASIKGRITKKRIETGTDRVELEIWYDGQEGIMKDIHGTEGPSGRSDFESLNLGLALARRLMLRNGGQMRVHQEEGLGTTITLSFQPGTINQKDKPFLS